LLRNFISFYYCNNYCSRIERNGRDQGYLIHTLRLLKRVVKWTDPPPVWPLNHSIIMDLTIRLESLNVFYIK